MAETLMKNIPCEDCKRETEHLEILNFRVLSCSPDQGDPGFCVIRYEEREGQAAAASGAPAAAISRATTGPATAGSEPATLTPTQVATAQAIINLFETGEVLGNYSQVTLLAHDTGHLTYGRSQTTLGSGNLSSLLQRYCANPGARFSERLKPFLARFSAKDLSLDHDTYLHNILRASADDRVMRETQDAFFNEVYWQPAQRAARQTGIATPLGVAVVYDSHVHGSWRLIRDRTNEHSGSVSELGEQAWISAYVTRRRQWLASHSRPDLRRTVYRMDAFRRLIEQEFWGLELPLVVRGAEISEATLGAAPPGCFDGPQPGTRPLVLEVPLQRGLDVRLVQLGLSASGVDIRADGVFGRTSAQRIREYQSSHGLPATGVAEVSLIGTLV